MRPSNDSRFTDIRLPEHGTANEADAYRREYFAAKAALQNEIRQVESMRASTCGFETPELDAKLASLKKKLKELRIKS